MTSLKNRGKFMQHPFALKEVWKEQMEISSTKRGKTNLKFLLRMVFISHTPHALQTSAGRVIKSGKMKKMRLG